MKNLHLLVAQRIRVHARGWLHRKKTNHLQQVILDHVANRAGFVVKLAAPLNAERFRHGDLDAVDVVAIPDRLEKGIGKAEDQQILDGFLTQIMVDSKNGKFGKYRKQDGVERARRSKVVAERLFDDYARAAGAIRLAQCFDDGTEQARRNR